MNQPKFFIHGVLVSAVVLLTIGIISIVILPGSLAHNHVIVTVVGFWWLTPLCAGLAYRRKSLLDDPEFSTFGGLRSLVPLQWFVYGGCAAWVLFELYLRPDNPRMFGVVCLLCACGTSLGYSMRFSMRGVEER